MDLPTPARNRDRKGAPGSTYLTTFICYGTCLPGQAGAVDWGHNRFGSRFPEPNLVPAVRYVVCEQGEPLAVLEAPVSR